MKVSQIIKQQDLIIERASILAATMRAYENGATVQWYSVYGDRWKDMVPHSECGGDLPSYTSDVRFRIKP